MTPTSSHFVRASAVLALALLAGSMLAPRDAAAAVPDPRTSTVPQCLTICPAGDRPFSIVVRDVNNSPVVGASVALDLSFCPRLVIGLCDDCAENPQYNPVARTLRRITDINGVATFRLCGSIFCADSPDRRWVEVSADGVVLALVSFVTTDLDGDLDVDAVDVFTVTAAQGGTLVHADEDCSRAIDAADVAIVTQHVGHVCAGVVPAAPGSWGTVKSLYR